MSADHHIVEHIVLLSFKPDVDSTKVETMINEVNALASLNFTLHLSVGKIIRCTSTSPNFSHIVHCRFRSTDDLQAYNQHPEHLRVLKNAQPLLDDFIVVDFLSDGGCDSLKPGSVMRVTLLKLKENLVEHDKGKLVEELKSQFKRTDDISVGESLANEMSKGYSIGVIAFYPDLEAIDSDAALHESEVKDLIESEIVVDYVVPLPYAAEH
ncbi:putative stress responsive alpha-beta barrel [Helianthus annuus]|nr:putative stress-response A/B barrel domain-containing protein HS1/DABB1 [Helianthus annuus]KAJ0503789.1 putative stress-response A/B barrel domain-containing protein HS1/DABB1 [Helianthus annuus]KAJ0676827.1 putative stress-response A/B barrel domain-containing protein HS1/DABB1 [Helianthus annuus]KAJ0864784.1 putative stress responsive alpha-beta barrel [Helianthus annuus]